MGRRDRRGRPRRWRLLRSIRLRLALFSTILVFALAAALLGAVNLVLTRSLHAHPVTTGREFATIVDPRTGEVVTIERDVQFQLVTLEELVNARALQELRRISLWLLLALFPLSVAVGWFVADRTLRPIARITGVAREIRRTEDLSRRIALEGTVGELKDLADTFDEMLDRIEAGVEAQRRVVQDVSHELRNPLAVMATNLDVVLADPDASVAELRRAAEVVRRTVDRTAAAVDDLVLVAREEVPESRRVPVDLDALCDEVVEEHRGPLEEQGVTVARRGEGIVVLADRMGVKRAFGNLLANAVRLTRPGSTIRVGCGADGAWAWLGVDDDGPGIDPRDHEHVFRRFWSRAGGSLGGEARSGLGLAIARQVAESHGGVVTVASERGAGAEFVLWLPLRGDAEIGAVTGDGIHPRRSPLRGDG